MEKLSLVINIVISIKPLYHNKQSELFTIQYPISINK